MARLRIGLGALLAAFGFSLWAWGRLPARVVTHWGVSGQPNGWSPRWVAVFLVPAIGVALAGLFTVLPRMDPRRRSYELHGSTWWAVANAVLVLLALVHVAAIGSNLGWGLPMGRLVIVGVGLLFGVIGNLMTRMRPNWFMGIRTPWTLSSDTVWRKTHRVGGYTFVAAGALMVVAGILRPAWAVVVGLTGAILAALIPVVYSYFAWKAEPDATRPREGRAS